MNDTRPQSNRAEILEAAEHISRTLRIGKAEVSKPHLAVILGSGLGEFAQNLRFKRKIPFSSIPHFRSPSAAGHAGVLVLGQAEGFLFAACREESTTTSTKT